MNNLEIAKQIVRSRFKNDIEEPLELTNSQAEIFNTIYLRQNLRSQIIACTQFGKSMTVALASICRSLAFKEPISIVAPSQPKAQIIMGNVIQHVFDHQSFIDKLEFEGSSIERLKHERSKTRITWKTGGEIKTISADSRNSKRVKDALMGFGSKNVIVDEASLIPDDSFSTVLRMVGGHKDGFLLKIGNPFYRNHFYRSWHNPKYKKVFIDYNIALAEGRYDKDFIEEMRGESLFDVFYECKFPEIGSIDIMGYRRLLSDKEIESCLNKAIIKTGRLRLGIDCAGGGDNTIFVLRTDTHAWIELRLKTRDTMTIVSEAQRLKTMYKIHDYDISIDDIGIGRGASDRLIELGMAINSVNVGDSPKVNRAFRNLKAEKFFLLQSWLRKGGILAYDDAWEQLSWMKYKITSDKVIQMKSKEEMRDDPDIRKYHSPDEVEALMLTFDPMDRHIQLIEYPSKEKDLEDFGSYFLPSGQKEVTMGELKTTDQFFV